MADGWTEAREELLKKLWTDEGLSASLCAKRIGGFEHCADGGRSAVIGKVHRLKLCRRSTNRVHRAPVKRKPAPKPPRKAMRTPTPLEVLFKQEPPMISVEEVFIPLDKRKGVLQLEEGDCKWPINDPRSDDFHFCAQPRTAGLPYCKHHAMRAFQPPKMPAIRAGVTAGAQNDNRPSHGSQNSQIATSGDPTRKLEPAE